MKNASIWLIPPLLLALCGGCQESSSSGAASRAGGKSAGDLATSVAEDPGAKIVYRKDGVAEVSFDSLKFDYRLDGSYSEGDLRDEIKALSGKRIEIRGYILPGSVYQDKGFDQFVLIRDNQQCCFGPGAKLYHNMQIKMLEGQTADYTTRPVTVEGTFKLSPYIAPDGKCYSVFYCAAERVRQ
jgi:hypothetical protein